MSTNDSAAIVPIPLSDQFKIGPLDTAPHIGFNINGSEEILKITNDGFFVRGERVPQDENEAKKVYEAFISLLKSTGFFY
jgi:hypothetical protein